MLKILSLNFYFPIWRLKVPQLLKVYKHNRTLTSHFEKLVWYIKKPKILDFNVKSKKVGVQVRSFSVGQYFGKW